MKRKVKMQLVGITMTLGCIVVIAGCNEQDDNPAIKMICKNRQSLRLVKVENST